MGGFSLFFVLPIPSHAEAESRAHALAACSLRKVAPGGLWLRASRRCTWRRASVEIGSACDEKKGPVARNTRRELDAKARCQQATAVGGERREAGGESRTRRFICASPDPPLLQADGDEVCRCVSVVGRCCERCTARPSVETAGSHLGQIYWISRILDCAIKLREPWRRRAVWITEESDLNEELER